MNIAEKHLGIEIQGNVVIRRSEFKEASSKFDQLVQDYYDNVNDDPEELFYKGICMSFEDFFSLNVDTFTDYVHDHLEEDEAQEEEERCYEWLKDYLPLLKEFEGFIIYFDVKEEIFEDWRKKNEI